LSNVFPFLVFLRKYDVDVIFSFSLFFLLLYHVRIYIYISGIYLAEV
jgi:hypothetical protein